jgi:phytoene dehydrogenase-like protein
VKQILVHDGGATAVRTASGEELSSTRAVVANIGPRRLFLDMLRPDALPSGFLRRARRYRYGPATFIVHFALDRPTAWTAGDDLGGFSYVHLNGSEAELAATYRDSLRGFLPARPLLVVSQTTALDPSRAPPGKHIMRVHVRTVPPAIEGDAMGTIGARDWATAKKPFAERILDLVCEHAPDLRKDIIGMAVESPNEIEQNNPNFVGGDCVAGSHHFDQNFFCRPFFGWSRYRTPVERLYMIGASTWPGGGISASSGYLLAKKLIHEH